MINDFLENYVGFTAKKSLLDDIHKSLIQERSKAIGYENKAVGIASVRVEDPKSKEILGLGASVPGDLILDNWGELFAVIHGPIVGSPGRTFVGLKNKGGTTGQTWLVWKDVNPQSWDFNLVARIGVGSGTTTPARTDFKIETNFANGGPEDSVVIVKQGAYTPDLGQVSVGSHIAPTAGPGTINEIVMEWQMNIQSGGNNFITMARDAISPGVTFLEGQVIFGEYIYQL